MPSSDSGPTPDGGPSASGAQQPNRVVDVPTSLGPARVHVDGVEGAGADGGGAGPVGLLVLGHGAGGGVQAPDLVAATACAVARGWLVLRVEQPWRVAGKRVASPPPRLDQGLTEVLGALRADPPDGLDAVRAGTSAGAVPMVLGGRSAGARVACRTAQALGASAVLCLAFPLHPPGRPERSRAGELALARVPLLVVQGERDPFGGPDDVRAQGPAGTRVVAVAGDHSLRGAGAVAEAVGPFLDEVAAAGP
ncbi:alpha/beta hydrolase family protein [Thalassiella azotivora]